jgi:hypothetical protein
MKKIVASYFACLAAFFVSRQDETEITKGFGPPRNIPKLSFAQVFTVRYASSVTLAFGCA